MTAPRRLAIVSFTGAQATGKTTLMNALRESIERESKVKPHVHPPHVIESVSSRWFRGEAARRITYKIEPLLKYDDIDRLGLRERCQREMGMMMLLDLQQTVADYGRIIIPNGIGTILIDRWFCDIATYTTQVLAVDEGSERKKPKIHDALNKILLEHYETMYERITALAGKLDLSINIVNVLVPRMDHISGVNDDKPNRGTHDPDQWQRILLEQHWNRFTSRGQRYRVIDRSVDDRLSGLKQVLHTLRF